ncbi:hypothetical protein FQN49_002674 [Arthroderma sp. PD_2]|nr:hypothetical protein FQN49_002674 [Arthroderma sp. PD_2]
MAPIKNHLNNSSLDEAPLSAKLYNELPQIDPMRDAAAKNARAHARLLGLTALNGLSDKFSFHLIHEYFDMPDGRVMVYETVKGESHPDFVLCSIQDAFALTVKICTPTLSLSLRWRI